MRSNDSHADYDANAEPRAAAPVMRRRDFLQRTAGGVLLSSLAARVTSSAAAALADEVTLTADGCALTLRVQDGAPVQVRSLRNQRTGFEWCQPGAPLEPVLTAATGPQGGWTAQRLATGRPAAHGPVEFLARHAASAVQAQYAWHAMVDVPIIEVRAELRHGGTQPLKAVTAFGAVRLRLRDDLGPLQLHQADAATGGPVVVEAVGTGEFLIAGLEWDTGGGRLEDGPDGRWIVLDVRNLTHDLAPGERLPTLRGSLGATHGDLAAAFVTIQRYLKRHVFPPLLPNWPWVDYGFWGLDAEGVQEAFLQEIDFAAEIGAELICHDASWYEGSEKTGRQDFWGVGIGHYTDDRVKYPMGLAAISRRIHEKGMKFGIWSGPNLIDPTLVGTRIPRRWLCQVDGQDVREHVWGQDDAHAPFQVCLGCPEYVEYLKQELTGVVERFHVDFLRWDDSGSEGECNRTDHGHQAGDFRYAWWLGHYEVFKHLHAKFPQLAIQTARYYGAIRMIRSADDEWLAEPKEGNAVTLDTYVRRNMNEMVTFGMFNGLLRQRISLYPAPMKAAIRRNILAYKRYRHLLTQDCYPLQPVRTTDTKWTVKEYVTPTGDEALVRAFRNGSPEPTVRLPLRGLGAWRSYELTSLNTGDVTVARGAELLREGLSLTLPQDDMSEIVLLRARSG